MKHLIFAAFFIGATVATAEGPAIEITSFVMQVGRVAELCGRVAGANQAFTAVRIVVDYKTKRPGVYYALAGKDGFFCATVVTYYGIAQASAELLGQQVASAPAQASAQSPRD